MAEQILFASKYQQVAEQIAFAAIHKKKKSVATLQEIVDNISDSLRYTIIFPLETYTTSVEKVEKGLLQKNFKKKILKNYWEKGDGYQGINAVFCIHNKTSVITSVVSPNGFKFELQFHTQQSFDVKMANHGLYEKLRVEKDPEKKLQYPITTK